MRNKKSSNQDDNISTSGKGNWWIAAPYKSPAQQIELERTRERLAMPNWAPMGDKPALHRKRMRAGGADPEMIERSIASTKQHAERS